MFVWFKVIDFYRMNFVIEVLIYLFFYFSFISEFVFLNMYWECLLYLRKIFMGFNVEENINWILLKLNVKYIF